MKAKDPIMKRQAYQNSWEYYKIGELYYENDIINGKNKIMN